MNSLNLPANFESYPEARKNGFLRMKDIKDRGGLQSSFLFFSFFDAGKRIYDL